MNDNAAGLAGADNTPARQIQARPVRVRGKEWIKRSVLAVVLMMAVALGLLYALGIWLPNYLEYRREMERIAQWQLEESRHPLRYRDLLEKYASQYNLDPALVASVILCESSFNPKAVSYLGAKGLMQLMPETARWVAGKFNTGYSDEELFDPETNIKYGCWFLSYLTGKFGGDTRAVTAGYHAGGGQVEAWLSDDRYAKDGELAHIPFNDTRAYVDRVTKAYVVYTRHYYAPSVQSDDAAMAMDK